MRIKKTLLLLSGLSLSLITSSFSISCIDNNVANDTRLNSLKNTLDNIIEVSKNKVNGNFNEYVSIVDANSTKDQSLFRILLDQPDLINTYLSINENELSSLFLNQDDKNNYEIYFSFFFDTIDSYGNKLKPFVSENRNSITIPVLVNLKDNITNNVVTKYFNFLTLNISNSTVDDLEDQGYNGNNGKQIVFENTRESILFRTIPSEMVDKYLDFISILENDDYKLPPKYQIDSNELKKWYGKTLSEVRSISQAIVAPTNRPFVTYSIKNSYFYDKERQYANFVMEIALDSSKFSSQVLDDAKKIYGLSFSYEYSIVVKEWAFAMPSSSEISSYVSNNNTMLSSLVEEAKNNIFIYTPTILLNPFDARNAGVKEIIEWFKKGIPVFEPPKSFLYVASNGQERQISFDIVSLEEGEESDSDTIKININMNIDKDDLMASSEFSKVFNLKTWQFQ